MAFKDTAFKFGGQESVVNCTELKLAQFTWTLIISKFSEFSSLACLFNYMVGRHVTSAHAVKFYHFKTFVYCMSRK